VAARVRLVAPEEVRAKSTPVPERLVVCAPAGALSVKVSAPETGPAVVGAKTIVMLQAALTASVVPQVFAARLKPGVTARFVMVSGRPPLLVRTRVWASAVRPTPVAGKLSVIGLSDTPGPAMPMPVRATVW